MILLEIKNFPPSSNQRLIATPMGLIKSKKYREWQAKELVNLAKYNINNTLEGNLYLYLEVFMPDRRKRDLDNITKSVQDILTLAKVYKDDSHIDKLIVVKKGIDKTKGIRVAIWQQSQYDPLHWDLDKGEAGVNEVD